MSDLSNPDAALDLLRAQILEDRYRHLERVIGRLDSCPRYKLEPDGSATPDPEGDYVLVPRMWRPQEGSVE